MSNPKRGSKVLIKTNAKVPAQFKGKEAFISRINYSSGTGYLYKLQVRDEFDPESNICDLMATDNDLIFMKD